MVIQYVMGITTSQLHINKNESSQFANFRPAAKCDNIGLHHNEIVSFNIYFDGQKIGKYEYLFVCQKFY